MRLASILYYLWKDAKKKICACSIQMKDFVSIYLRLRESLDVQFQRTETHKLAIFKLSCPMSQSN